MQVELTAVLPVEKETLRNLLEKYNYEFSQQTDSYQLPMWLFCMMTNTFIPLIFAEM